MVDRFTVYPGVTYHTGQPHQNIKGEYVRYSDYEALQKELAERTAERDDARAEIEHWQKGATCGCRYDSPDDVCDLHSPAVAAEKSRADTLARRVEGLEAALEMIAGKRPCIDNLMGNVDIALAALTGERP